MAYAFGNLKERLTGSLFRFVPDGTEIDDDPAVILASATAAPDAAFFTDDWSMGRVNNSKYVPKTKDRVREWSKPTGGYKERTTKTVTEEAFEITVIDYATGIFDKLMFGLEADPVAATAQQAFSAADRYVDGWGQFTLIEEDGTISGVLVLHARLEIQTVPEMKNEDGSPVWRIAALGDGGALDTYTPYPA